MLSYLARKFQFTKFHEIKEKNNTLASSFGYANKNRGNYKQASLWLFSNISQIFDKQSESNEY